MYIGGYYYDGSNYFGALLKSKDGGASWTSVNSGITGYAYTMVIDPVSPNKVYVGSFTGIFRSDDGGEHWFKNNGYAYGYRMAIDPQNTDIIYAGYGNDFFKSTDAGVSLPAKIMWQLLHVIS